MPVTMKVYAALHDHISEGFVWLGIPGLRRRSIVKITNAENRRTVFCEALQFEENFRGLYNQPPRIGIPADQQSSSIIMNHWYRSRLGDLQTQQEYLLEIVAARWWWGKLRACLDHPQIIVRFATWLSMLSVTLAVTSLFLALIPLADGAKGTRTSSRRPLPILSLDSVLAWRYTYADLLGKPRTAVRERFGMPQYEDGHALTWDASPKTGDRQVSVLFESTTEDAVAKAVKVFARPTESLDAMEVLKKGPMFKFDTGMYTDAARTYFTATTRDDRNILQFTVAESGVQFASVGFTAFGQK